MEKWAFLDSGVFVRSLALNCITSSPVKFLTDLTFYQLFSTGICLDTLLIWVMMSMLKSLWKWLIGGPLKTWLSTLLMNLHHSELSLHEAVGMAPNRSLHTSGIHGHSINITMMVMMMGKSRVPTPWKVVEFLLENFQDQENPEKWPWSWKVLEFYLQDPRICWTMIRMLVLALNKTHFCGRK